MVGELMTLPLRVGVRATQLWLRAVEETVALVAGATDRLLGKAAPPSASPPPASTPEAPPTPEVPATAEASVIDAPPREPEPVHVSEEPEVVEEVADPGAEDGAGAAVHVDAPWEGYDELRASDVIERLAGASNAELAAIQLYESERKGRATVLHAVERELRISTGSGSQS
jgi:hypothetical protein